MGVLGKDRCARRTVVASENPEANRTARDTNGGRKEIDGTSTGKQHRYVNQSRDHTRPRDDGMRGEEVEEEEQKTEDDAGREE